MATVTIEAGLIDRVISSLGNFTGKKKIPLAVRIDRVQQVLVEYDRVWRKENLNPSIAEFTDGKDEIPDDDVGKFIEAYPDVFSEAVEIEIEPLTTDELSELEIDDFSLRLLRQVGLLVDE